MHEQNLNSTKICLKKKKMPVIQIWGTRGSLSPTRCGHIRPDTVQHQKELGARHASTRSDTESEEFILVFSSWAEGHLPSVHMESVSFQLSDAAAATLQAVGKRKHTLSHKLVHSSSTAAKIMKRRTFTQKQLFCVAYLIKNLKVTTYFIVYSSCVLSEAHYF